MLPVALKAYKPDIVIIDGIADLLLDINDGPKAIQLMEELLGLSDVYNCNIVTIIHLNRSGEKNNLRGWLGSVMLQKSYEVFNCSKIYQTDILSVEFNTSRHTHCNDKLFYKVNDSGIPFETEEPDTQKRDAEGKFTSKKYDGDTSRLFNQDYYNRLPDSTEDSQNWDLVRLFEDAIAGMASVAYHDMEDRVMKIGNIQHKQYYYRLLAKAEEQGIVRKTYDRSKRIVIIMPPQG